MTCLAGTSLGERLETALVECDQLAVTSTTVVGRSVLGGALQGVLGLLFPTTTIVAGRSDLERETQCSSVLEVEQRLNSSMQCESPATMDSFLFFHSRKFPLIY